MAFTTENWIVELPSLYVLFAVPIVLYLLETFSSPVAISRPLIARSKISSETSGWYYVTVSSDPFI